MKRQSSVASSSSLRRENAPEKIHAKTIGCMSRILHLLSNPHSPRTTRFLTFRKKQIQNGTSSPATPHKALLSKPQPPNSALAVRPSKEQIPRSPTLPAEIRRSIPVKPPLETLWDPAAMAARVEEGPATPESVAEKRQRLLGALQKCDEDLKALKKIIDSVRSAEQLRTPSPAVSRSRDGGGGFGDTMRTVSEVTCSVFNGERQQPSPVSVLDEFTRSPLSPSTYSYAYSARHSFGRIQQRKQQLWKKPGEEEISSTYIYERMTSELALHTKGQIGKDEDRSVMWSSKAMTETVEEVCRDIAWGEKRELGKIGLALQDHICRDLIEETVRELRCCCSYPMPFEVCKRRLCF